MLSDECILCTLLITSTSYSYNTIHKFQSDPCLTVSSIITHPPKHTHFINQLMWVKDTEKYFL